MVMTRQGFQDYMTTYYNFIIYTNNNMISMLECGLTNDKTIGDTFRLSLLRRNALINSYLAAWDAAPNDPAKEAVEASVMFDLGSASFNPGDAVKWPQTGGLFGDVHGNGTVTDASSPVYNGANGQLIKQGIPVQNVFNVAVNGKTVGNTLMFTSDASKRFIPTGVNVSLLNVSGLALVATLSVGTNSTNYNNVSASTLLTGLSTQTQVLALPLIGNLNSIPAGSAVYVRVSIGSTATTYDLNVSLTGYYI